MSRSNRWHSLRHRAEFLQLQQHGRKWVTPAFVIHVSYAEKTNPPHIGFTATKKLGGAVIRNRIRRRLRAAIDQVAIDSALPPMKLAITARGEAETKDLAELVRDLKWALRKTSEDKSDAE